MKKNIAITLLLITFFNFTGSLFLFPAEAMAQDLGSQCAAISESSSGCPNAEQAECKALLEKCAAYYDQQTNELAADLTKTSQQKNTLQNQINTLKKKIQNLDAEINRGNIMVKDLNMQIADTQVSIGKTSGDIESSQEQMKAILKSVYEEDRKPSFVVLLEGNLSDFFNNLTYLDGLNAKVSKLLDSTKQLKDYLESQQEKMSTSADQLQKTLALQSLQKEQNMQNQKEQNQYLKLTEAQYQQQLKEKQEVEQKSAKIKSMLFQTVGVSKVPTFGEALEVAKIAAASVGIRPAFLLAVISQESAIGRNVGQCVLTDDKGNGKKISTGVAIAYPRAMHPTRDIPPFLNITKTLGRNPYDTPVSCWIYDVRGGQPYGYGGAMGPAQFIPSTWNLYVPRLTSILGATPNPWAIRDSFTASGLYLADLGATAQTTAKESNAASRYYGGSSSYARSVLNRASCIQTFIDEGTMSASCQKLIF